MSASAGSRPWSRRSCCLNRSIPIIGLDPLMPIHSLNAIPPLVQVGLSVGPGHIGCFTRAGSPIGRTALIDTGASQTAITPAILAALVPQKFGEAEYIRPDQPSIFRSTYSILLCFEPNLGDPRLGRRCPMVHRRGGRGQGRHSGRRCPDRPGSPRSTGSLLGRTPKPTSAHVLASFSPPERPIASRPSHRQQADARSARPRRPANRGR